MSHPATPLPNHALAEGAQRPRRKPADRRRELDHRMANSLQLATDFLLFEQARLSDPAARAALAEAAARLSAVGQLHRFLCDREDAAAVDLEAFLGELCGLIAAGTGLACSVDSDAATLPTDVAQQLAIAINELAMNAAKHGYRSGEPGSLHVECRRSGGTLRVTVSDEGRGLGHEFSPQRTHGLGMTILQAIVRQLHATLEARDDHGARFTITLPLAPELPPASRSFAPVDREP
ncbi:MAG: two-component system sensor histidine kinase/response regulator [Phenylobacterium sp.]|nr:two-component system sensor histidine kinase/response regulator [Phenylobacterium sp.]